MSAGLIAVVAASWKVETGAVLLRFRSGVRLRLVSFCGASVCCGGVYLAALVEDCCFGPIRPHCTPSFARAAREERRARDASS